MLEVTAKVGAVRDEKSRYTVTSWEPEPGKSQREAEKETVLHFGHFPGAGPSQPWAHA